MFSSRIKNKTIHLNFS